MSRNTRKDNQIESVNRKMLAQRGENNIVQMRDERVNKIIEEKSNKIIRGMGIICAILVLILLGKIFLINNQSGLVLSLIDLVRFINGSLAIACVLCCLILLKRGSNEILFSLILIYLSLGIGIVAGQFDYLMFFHEKLVISNFITISTSFLRLIIMFSIIKPNSYLNKAINKFKVASIAFVVMYTLVIGYIEVSFEMQGVMLKEFVYIIVNISLIIGYGMIAIKMAIISIKQKKVIIASFSGSAFLLTIKTIYTMYGLGEYGSNMKPTSILITFLAFFIILIGCIIELYLLYIESKHLNNELERFYNLANNNRYASMFICNKDVNVTYINEKIKEEFSGNITLEGFKKKVLNLEDVKFNMPLIMKSIEERNSWRGIIKNVDKSQVIDVYIQTINNGDNRSNLEYLVTYIDISETMKLESQIQLNKLHEVKKSEFIAVLSHELKTPLNIFSATIQLIESVPKSRVTETYYKHKDSLRVNCKRMLRLINNIIDTTRMDSGEMKPNFGNYEMVSIFEDIILSKGVCCNSKNLEIVFDTNVEEQFIKCDPVMIEKIALNLLSNAIKYSYEYGRINVDFISDKQYVRIRVKDNGIGIEEELVGRVFERFLRGDTSLNRANEGSGIGLSIVKALVDSHNGEIIVKSKLGKGSTFEVLFPKILDPNKPCEHYRINQESSELELSDIY